MIKKQKHILVIRLSAMGDVAMTIPVLKALTEEYPEVKITLLSQPFFEPIFKNIPNLSFVAIDKKGEHKGILGLRKLAKEIALLDIDCVADLHNVLRSNILVRLLKLKGIPFQQIDKGRAEKKALTRNRNKDFRQLKTTHERYTDVFRNLGFKVDLSKQILSQKEELSEKITETIGKTNLPKIGIAPFAAHKGKQYPLHFMEEVIQEISKEYQVVLFGSPNEAIQLEQIQEKYDNCVSIASKLTFSEELQLISNLDVMVSMDSGNGHLAANYGIPVITIWGITHPFAGFAPINQRVENQITPDLNKFPMIPTSIYGKDYPNGYLSCFETILPEQIIRTIKKALS